MPKRKRYQRTAVASDGTKFTVSNTIRGWFSRKLYACSPRLTINGMNYYFSKVQALRLHHAWLKLLMMMDDYENEVSDD